MIGFLLDLLTECVECSFGAGRGGSDYPTTLRHPYTSLTSRVESGSGLAFADFFQNERDGGRKGIVVVLIGGSS